MARFAGTQRSKYTSERVRYMRLERERIKSKKDGVSSSQLQNILGKLQAAGHLKIIGFENMQITPDTTEHGWTKKMNINFRLFNQNGFDDRPHFSGYLRSASDADKNYQLKGWFNEDGSMRIELVN